MQNDENTDNNIDEDTPIESDHKTDEAAKKHEKRKRLIIGGAVVVALFIIGFVAATSSSDESAGGLDEMQAEQSNNDTTDTTETYDITYESRLDQIVYAFQESFDSDVVIYARPAAGGDRVELTRYPADVSTSSLAYASNWHAAFRSQNIDSDTFLFWQPTNGLSLYDSGEIVMLWEAGENDYVQSAALSAQRDEVAFLVADAANFSGSKLYVIDIETKEVRELPIDTETVAQPTPIAFDDENGIIYHAQDCFPGCDGISGNIYAYDIASAKSSEINTENELFTIVEPAFNATATEIIYGARTFDDTLETESFFGGYIGPPTTIYRLNLLSEASSTVVGSLGELQGDEDVGGVNWQLTERGQSPVYGFGNKLIGLNGGERTLYEGSGSSMIPLWVSSHELVVQNAPFDDFTVSYLDFDEGNAKTVLSGTNLTSILGFTFTNE